MHPMGERQLWEDTLSGRSDIISEENEAAAQALLQRMCNQVQSSNGPRKEALAGSDDTDMQASTSTVVGMLEEENTIAQMVKDAIQAGWTDW